MMLPLFLIKNLARLRDEMVMNAGSVQAVITLLEPWYGNGRVATGYILTGVSPSCTMGLNG